MEKIKKEFVKAFAKHVLAAKEKKLKKEQGYARVKKKIKIEKTIAAEKLRPSVLKRKQGKERELETLAVEKPEEAEEIKVIPAPKPTPTLLVPPAPIYRRALPPLPRPPILAKHWPLPPIPPAPARAAIIAFDLGKLNSLIADPTIKVIQCDGPNIPIKITKETQEQTAIMLGENEIRSTIKKFADRAGQAISEPIFKATVGNLTISAIISAFAKAKFVITKS